MAEIGGLAGRPPALVLGLDSMTGLQTARILAERAIPVIGVAADPHHYACRSRRVTQVLPGAPELLSEILGRVDAELERPFVVIACADRWVSALVGSRPRWPDNVRAVVPDADIVDRLMDKARFAEFATAHDLPVPRTVILSDRQSVEAASREISFPAVVKPASKPDNWDVSMGGKVTVVSDGAELEAVTDRGLALADALVAQEWVDGGEDCLISFNGYFDRQSQPRAAFVARKLRQWPPGAGTSASGEEVRDDEVLELATELFQKAGFQGLAYLEVKRSPSSSKVFVIEPNVGRPTGRAAISEAGGVELIYSAYRDALGLAPLTHNHQTYRGVKWVYLRHDLQAAAVAIKAGELTPRAWVSSLRGPKAYAVWSLRDPLPFFVDIVHTVRQLRCRRASSGSGGMYPSQPLAEE